MLDKITLKADIKAAFEFEALQDADPDLSRERIAQKIADAIDKFVKSGEGIYQAGTLKAGSTVVVAAPATIVKIQ